MNICPVKFIELKNKGILEGCMSLLPTPILLSPAEIFAHALEFLNNWLGLIIAKCGILSKEGIQRSSSLDAR